MKIIGSPWYPMPGYSSGAALLQKWNKTPENLNILITHPQLGIALKIKKFFFTSHLSKVTETIIYGTNVTAYWPVVLKYNFIAAVVNFNYIHYKLCLPNNYIPSTYIQVLNCIPRP